LNYVKKNLTSKVKEVFRQTRKAYGTRRIKVELKKANKIVSRRRIKHIMDDNALVSTYTKKKYRREKQAVIRKNRE